jgi:hypothetical protein
MASGEILNIPINSVEKIVSGLPFPLGSIPFLDRNGGWPGFRKYQI